MLQTIGVLTSGGDSPGMNPAIRAVFRTAMAQGVKVVGINNGYDGIFDHAVSEFDERSLTGILDRGGTVLQSSRCKRFYTPEGREKALQLLREMQIGGLVVIGGDGSLSGALELHRLGFPTVGIPGSIDNDLHGTEMSIGADTAANTIVHMVDKINDTARSHRRCFLVEVMGRNSGYLALTTAISTGAEVAVIPEFRFNMERILDLLHSRFEKSRDNSTIILAEGVCDAETFIRRMAECRGGDALVQEIRKTVLGHVQRGGVPTHFDRMLAARMGELAVVGLLQGESGVMTALRKSRMSLLDLEEVIGKKKHPAPELIRLARHLGIEFGDPVEV